MTVFCDMDGVLTDFVGRCNELLDFDIFKAQEQYGMDCIWDPINKFGIGFWSGMSWIKGGKELWEVVSRFSNIKLLTAVPDHKLCPYATIGKKTWILNNIGSDIDYIITSRSRKVQHCTSDSILIDDFSKTVQEWNQAGGEAILHNSDDVASTIARLEQFVN